MFNHKYKPVAEVCFDIKNGIPKFNYKAKEPFSLTILLICLFLKTKWLFAGQDDINTFKVNFNDMVKDDSFPESINGISSMLLDFRFNMTGKTTLTLYKNKNGDIRFTSYFPFSYSNIDIINIGIAFVDGVTSLYDNNAKEFCKETFRFFKDIILDDNDDESMERLLHLFDVVSEFIRQLENT